MAKLLSDSDANRLQIMLRWFERTNRKGTDYQKRRVLDFSNNIMLAKTQEASPADNKISVKMVDGSGTEIGNAFNAYGVFTDDATTFDTVTPQIDSGTLIPVYRDQGGNWRVALTLTSVGDECEVEE